MEQIAGDLLPAASPPHPTLSPSGGEGRGAERDRLATATGFLALGVKDVNQRFKVRFVMDNVDEQIDAVTRSVLALTVSCARCHDHKFDPIPITDYYALSGIFTSTDNCAGVRNKMGGGGLDYYDPAMLVVLATHLPSVASGQVEKLKVQVAQAKKEWEAIRGTPHGLSKGLDGFPKQRPYRLKYERLQNQLLALTDPVARGDAVHGVRDAKKVSDTAVRIRGEAEKLGPAVPRGFLTAFDVIGTPMVNPKNSGRLELAHWLTSPTNPLTPRVIVNRVWQHLFGQGIVTTVDNFGVSGDTLIRRFDLKCHVRNREGNIPDHLRRSSRSSVGTVPGPVVRSLPDARLRFDARGPIMQMVKIHIPERSDRAKALETITLRGRVICLPDNVFIVPEPALEVLRSLAVAYQELDRGGIDYAEKALRDSLAGPAQRRATG